MLSSIFLLVSHILSTNIYKRCQPTPAENEDAYDADEDIPTHDNDDSEKGPGKKCVSITSALAFLL